MDGKELFNQLSVRDYSDSEADQYAQTLQTMFFHCTMSDEIQKFYNLLEQAESENKKLVISDDQEDEYDFASISLS